ncbi:thioesterase family protein [Fontimonas sp. SYSU GA230001]|uniref:acyl-CoA thioesterase n=1 Tax=Fontimonas sp. SYSU GA230001 TaxID=3142450 RepID=UPI0032B41A30
MKDRLRLNEFVHVIEIETRWADLDALGHVNNTRFFTFDESARLDYFGELMRSDSEFWKSRGLILAHIECDFLAQLHHPSRLRVGLRISRLGRSSMNTLAGMFVGEHLIAVTRGVVVWFDYTRQKAQPIPENVRAMIRARERVAPEESV